MPDYDVQIRIMPKKSVVDAASVQISALLERQFSIRTANLSLGKHVQYRVNVESEELARRQAEELSNKFLANFNVEDYHVSVTPVNGSLPQHK